MKPFDLGAFRAGKPALSAANGKWCFVGELPEFCNPDSTFGVIATSFNGEVAYFDRNGKARDLAARNLTHMAPQKQKMYVGVRVYGSKATANDTSSAYSDREYLERQLATFRGSRDEWQICEIEVEV